MEWTLEGSWTFEGERTGTSRVYADSGWWNVGGTSSFSLKKSRLFAGHVDNSVPLSPSRYSCYYYIKFK